MSYMTLKTLAELAESVGYQCRINTAAGDFEYHDGKDISDHREWTYICPATFVGHVIARKLDMSIGRTEARAFAEGTELNQIEDRTGSE